MISFNKINWHDGILRSIKIIPEDRPDIYGKIELTIEVYPDNNAKDRHQLKIIFQKVQQSNISCDFIELLDNRNAGNISNAYQKSYKPHKNLSIFRIYLVDGYIEILGEKNVKIVTP